jgi:glycosyltransferase involved in cell wall biosynthesis
LKVLQVIHGYPPYYRAGSEVYTNTLSVELVKYCDVYVFTRVENPFEPPYTFEDSVDDGVHIRRVNNPERNYTLMDNYLNPEIDRAFREYVEYVRPDVVHIGHLSHLSTNIVRIAKERYGLPVVFTLHDFWLYCFRGQLITPENRICQESSIEECMHCVRQKFKYMESEDTFRAYRKHMEAIIGMVDVFIAPSRHVRQYFIDHGVPPEKIVYEKYGLDKDAIRKRKKKYGPDGHVNFGFAGRVIPVKGVDKLIKTYKAIAGNNTSLLIYGGAGSSEAFLKKYGDASVLFKGEFDKKGINDVYGNIDVLVVPSIWYEVAPLVIQEAFIAGVPVITTDIGGMVELVDDGVDGFKFPLSDWNALQSIMSKIARDPTTLNGLSPSSEKVLSIEDHARHIYSLYKEVANDGGNTLLHGRALEDNVRDES